MTGFYDRGLLAIKIFCLGSWFHGKPRSTKLILFVHGAHANEVINRGEKHVDKER